MYKNCAELKIIIMRIAKFKKVVAPIGVKNNEQVYGIKLLIKGLADSFVGQRGNILVFDTEEEAQEFIDDEDNF